jgi:mannose/cellobiose epimerase-like protein (N-acyl-D-glucosamine 2-epimerase family)
MNDVYHRINDAYHQMKQDLEGGGLPFWMKHGLDSDHEGYLTCSDAECRATDNIEKISSHRCG